jgi:hypothetical protein
MPTRRTLLAAAPLLAAPQLLRAATPRPPIVGHIALDGGRIYAGAQINGERLMFVVDTGTTQNKIRPDVAARLKLSDVAANQIGGLGRNRVMTKQYIARDVIIGGMVRQPVMSFESYDFGTGLRRDAAGLLAAGVFTSYASAIDFVKGEWTLYLDGLPDMPGYRALPTKIARLPGDQSERIIVDATFEGIPLKLMVDTGAPRNLLLFPETSRRLKLFEGNRPFVEIDTHGFGGKSAYPSRSMRAGALQVGPYRFEEIGYAAMDPRDRDKNFGADGVIGLSLIGLFDLAIDPRKDRLLVRRNALPHVEREPLPKA